MSSGSLRWVCGEAAACDRHASLWLTTVHWICNPSYKWKTFVANSVCQVQEISKKVGIVWNHCPVFHNPIDLPSRGRSAQQIRSPF